MSMFPAVMLLSAILCAHPVLEAGLKAGANLPKQGVTDNYLMGLAEVHARSMATRQHQDHNGWDHRFQDIYRTLPNMKEASEICAESWPDETMEEAAAGCWKDWKQSPGHWRTANGKPDLYGVAMARGKNGIWYICIIAVWEKP